MGDRFALLGHAVGFIDPLFSKGLYVSMMSTCLLAHLLLEARESGDYSAAAFQPLEKSTLAFIASNDRLIANAYKSFADYRLWNVYSVLWLLGAYTELVRLGSVRLQARDRHEYHALADGLKLVGGGFHEFDAVAAQVDGIMEALDLANDDAVVAAAAEMQALLRSVEWMPKPFLAVLDGKNHLPENKLRPGLLTPNAGFLGHGAYREHFFGSRSTANVIQAFVERKIALFRACNPAPAEPDPPANGPCSQRIPAALMMRVFAERDRARSRDGSGRPQRGKNRVLLSIGPDQTRMIKFPFGLFGPDQGRNLLDERTSLARHCREFARGFAAHSGHSNL